MALATGPGCIRPWVEKGRWIGLEVLGAVAPASHVVLHRIAYAPSAVGAGIAVPTLFQRLPRWRGRAGGWLYASAEASLVRTAVAARVEALRRVGEECGARRYFGVVAQAVRVLNHYSRQLLGRLPSGWVRVLRRYPPSLRGGLFRLFCADGVRLVQLAETAPVLTTWLIQSAALAPMAKEPAATRAVRAAVRAGARLRGIMAMAGIPYAWRWLPPGAMARWWRLRGILLQGRGLVGNCAPRSLPALRRWLRALELARGETADQAFIVWAARACGRGQSARLALEPLRQVARWAEVCQQVAAGTRPASAETAALGVRWNPRMSPQRAVREAFAWRARSLRLDGGVRPFAPALVPAGCIGEWSVEPVRDREQLMRLGMEFRNCAMDYGGALVAGNCSLYVVRDEGGRGLAMLHVRRDPVTQRLRLVLARGPCNKGLPQQVRGRISGWLGRAARGVARCA